uniref:excalibur calcium-binding domain-containing protein n=1 Tax=Frankia tisae TaxID=2950104 RepID=UPI0021C0E73A
MVGSRRYVGFLAGRGGRIGLGVLGALVAVVIVAGIFGGSSKPANLVDASARVADSTPPPAAGSTPLSALSPSDTGSPSGVPSDAGSPSPGGARLGLPYSAALAGAPGTDSAHDTTTGSGTAGTGTASGGTAGDATASGGTAAPGTTGGGDALAPAATGGPTQASGSAHYDNCTAARDAGVAPLHRGDPGYRAGLDADGDGIACETSTGPTTTRGVAPTTMSGSTDYANCTAARNAGVAPLYRGDPGYRAGLDADGDGIACETSTSTVQQQPPAAPPAAQAAATSAAPTAAAPPAAP